MPILRGQQRLAVLLALPCVLMFAAGSAMAQWRTTPQEIVRLRQVNVMQQAVLLSALRQNVFWGGMVNPYPLWVPMQQNALGNPLQQQNVALTAAQQQQLNVQFQELLALLQRPNVDVKLVQQQLAAFQLQVALAQQQQQPQQNIFGR